jgi:hypothetical protein
MTDCEPEQEVRDLFQGDLIVSATSLRAPENSSHDRKPYGFLRPLAEEITLACHKNMLVRREQVACLVTDGSYSKPSSGIVPSRIL